MIDYLNLNNNKKLKSLNELCLNHFRYTDKTCYTGKEGYECFIYSYSDAFTLRAIIDLDQYEIVDDDWYSVNIYYYFEHGCGGLITTECDHIQESSESDVISIILNSVNTSIDNFIKYWLNNKIDDYYLAY